MRLQFDIYEYLFKGLPIHKRQTNRLKLFWWTIKQINGLWDSFVIWRVNMIFQSNITGQKLSLVSLLNKDVTGSNNQIYIDEVNDYGVYLSLESENQDFSWLSTASEDTDYEYISLYGEIAEALGSDFVIYIPTGASAPETKEIAERYVLAQMDYVIQEF